MRLKHFGIGVLALIFSFGTLVQGNHAAADQGQESKIILDGHNLNLEVPPVNEHGTVMVPMRPIFEALQAELAWIESNQTIVATKDAVTIKLSIGSPFAYINDRAVVLNAEPYVTQGNAMVPVRFVSEAFGAFVAWSSSEQLVTITTTPAGASEEQASVSSEKASGDSAGSADYIPSKLTLQFVPSQSAETMKAAAKPLEKILGDRLGIPVKVGVSSNYNTVIEAMAARVVDVSFLPPSGYIIAHDKHKAADVLLQATRNGIDTATGKSTEKLVDFYQSMFVVKADSPIKTIEDLKGKRIGWQAPTSAAGYIYPRALLEKNGIHPQTDMQNMELRGHDKAIVALLQDQVDAVAVFQDARTILLREYPNVMKDTRIIAFTDKIPNDPITVRSDMNPSWKKKIQDAFIDLGNDPVSQRIIYDLFAHKGYTASDDNKFDIVREVNKLMGE